MKLVYEFNTKTKGSLKFGVNSAVKLIQETNEIGNDSNDSKKEKNKEPILIFMFYDEKFKIIIDMIIIKCKELLNVKFYLIDKNYK